MTPLVDTFFRRLIYWWGLFVVLQQAERLFLLPETASIESPTLATLSTTLVTGLRADLIVAGLAVVIALMLSVVFWIPFAVSRRSGAALAYLRCFRLGCWLIAGLIVFALTIDMGYYGYNRQHLDSVFFEYLDDLLSKGPEPTAGAATAPSPSQALTQMRTEVAEAGKWATRVLMFALVMGTCLFLWGRVFLRRMEPVLVQWRRRSPKTSTTILPLLILVPITGFHSQGPWSIARVGIPSTSYYLLAQNPIWYGGDVLLGSLAFRMSGGTSKIERLMPVDEAIQITRAVLAPDARFTNARYPLVRQSEVSVSTTQRRLPNIVILYIEGLDRRFLGKSLVVEDQLASSGSSLTDLYKDGVRTRFLPASSGVGVRLTPFLDQLAEESVFLEHFFSNGRLTHQGLFSSLCSYYSGHTKSPIKARYTYDYLCLPSLLSKAGYRTEMVIGQNRDYHQDHTALFLARNGLHQFFDESNAPPDAERLGLGLTDGEIFGVLRQRVQALREKGTPFFLAALTLSTHHPYAIPLVHSDVRLLSADRDPYLASLRYTDLELGLFFRGLEKEGLLENTIVFIMGDHGRHEYIGATDLERWVGHHTTPLFIWMDQSLRTTRTYRPRTTSTVASHVDLTPTILGLSGLQPRVSPFLGHDLSCLVATECGEQNLALISSAGTIGVVQGKNILLYSREPEMLLESDVDLSGPVTARPTDDQKLADQFRRLKALFVSSAILLDENRVWSWKEFGSGL